MVDALRRASAGRITAVIPYFGYARQDRRVRSARVPITAKVVADFLSSVGVDRVLTVDLHAEQIQGFFDVPVDNVFGSPILLEDMLQLNLDNPIVVSPDIGGVVRARAIAKLLNDTDMAIIDKRRPRANVSQVMHIIGDVAGRDCVLVDELATLGLTLGADVPVFVRGHAAFAEGVGEVLTPVDVAEKWYLVAHPGVSIPTPIIFSRSGAATKYPGQVNRNVIKL